MLLEHGPLEYAHGDYKYSRSKATSLCSSDDLTARERYYIRTITKNSFESLVLRVIDGMLSTITSWILFVQLVANLVFLLFQYHLENRYVIKFFEVYSGLGEDYFVEDIQEAFHYICSTLLETFMRVSE